MKVEVTDGFAFSQYLLFQVMVLRASIDTEREPRTWLVCRGT